MSNMFRRAAVLAVASAASAGSLLAVTPVADAAPTCEGSLAESLPLTSAATGQPDDLKHGQVDVYTSSAQGGTKCIVTRVNNFTAGEQVKLTAKLAFSDGGGYGEASGTNVASTRPVSLTHAAGRCINIQGSVAVGGDTYSVDRRDTYCDQPL